MTLRHRIREISRSRLHGDAETLPGSFSVRCALTVSLISLTLLGWTPGGQAQPAAASNAGEADAAGSASSDSDDILARIGVGLGYGIHDVFSTQGEIARGSGPHIDLRLSLGRKLSPHDSLFADVYWQKPFIVAGGEVTDANSGETSSARIQSVIGFGLGYERGLRAAPWAIGGGAAVLYRPLDVSAFPGATEDMVQGGGLGLGLEATVTRYWRLSEAAKIGAAVALGSQVYFDESEHFAAGYATVRVVFAFD